MKLITEFIFSDDGRIACDKCGQFTWQRDLSMIGKDFMCQSCASDMDIAEDLEVLMDDFEEWGTGGGCTARVKYLQIENELHTLVVTNAHGDSDPSLKHGISYALYKGDWGSDVHPAHMGHDGFMAVTPEKVEKGYWPKVSGQWTGNYFNPSDDLNEGLDEIKQIIKMGE